MYRSARPLLGLARPALRPARTVVFPSAAGSSFRIAAAPSPSTSRGYAVKINKADIRGAQRANIKINRKADEGYRASDIEKLNQKAMSHILLPGTFVPIPFADHDKDSRQALRALVSYLYAQLWQRGKDLAAVVGAKWMSMPAWRERPRLQLQYRQVAPTAKALHIQLNQALAAADRDALRRICAPRLAETLSAAVSRRKASEAVTWELVDSKAPRVVSHKLAMMPPVGKGPFVQQAVVRITSTQKLGKTDRRTGEPVEGGTTLRRLTEYLVLTRELDKETYRPGDWLIWGSINPTTAAEWAQEERSLKLMEQHELSNRSSGKQ